jgi:hypothetical protein
MTMNLTNKPNESMEEIANLMQDLTGGYKITHIKSNSHAHYFTGVQKFDINEEVKVVINNPKNLGKWEVFSRFEGIEYWYSTNEFIDSETLTFLA